MDELRRKGLEKMNEVYGWEMPNIEGDPYFDLTVDHLFGSIWTRPGLSMRDKRLMTLTAVTAVELAEALKPQGIHVVDAPVSGGAAAAAKGELATMVGAEREVYEKIKPAFKHWAAVVIHAGEPGAGTRMKLARNMLTFTSYAAACEAMKLAEAAGLDLQALGRVVRHTDALTGGPGAIMVREDMKDLEPENFLYQPFLHTRGLGEKDLSLALALGEAVSVDLPLAQLAYERLAAGLGIPHKENES